MSAWIQESIKANDTKKEFNITKDFKLSKYLIFLKKELLSSNYLIKKNGKKLELMINKHVWWIFVKYLASICWYHVEVRSSPQKIRKYGRTV